MFQLEDDMLVLLAELVSLIYLLGVAFAIHALIHGRTSQGTIAWFIALLSMPFIATPLYAVFGFYRFRGYVNARREGAPHLSNIREAILKNKGLESLLVENTTPFMEVASSLVHIPFSRANSAHLLIDGEATFEAVFRAIEEARSYILVQFYIIKDDELGLELKYRLMERLRAGVRVYMLYDDIGSHALSGRYLDDLREAGAEVSGFATFTRWKNRFRLNFRNHRKIVVVDGRQAFVGGHNIGNEYVGKSSFGHWRDTHVALRGPVVQGVQLVFCEDWFWATEQQLELDWQLRIAEEPGISALVLPSGPADDRETCTLFFVAAINTAKQRLWIVSPYFVPDEQVMTALELAVLRGVEVRVMLPARADHLLVYLSSYSYLKEAEASGVRFFRYQEGFLHQKVILVDEDISMVGTANFDNRSFRINFEITMLFTDRGFAREVETMLRDDFSQCHEVGKKDYQGKPVWYRLAARVARLFAPIQ
jgi:cardiolipin synthase